MQFPLIEKASSLFDEDHLEECYIIGVQHILPSTYVMLNTLFKKGLKKSNLSILGKCYSTNPDTYKKMQEDGLDVCKLSINFDSHEEYDLTFKNKIKRFLYQRKHIFKGKYKKIIILDDGGELIEELDKYIDDYENIICMEQTSAGFNRLKNKNLSFPIINLARSNAKLASEPDRVIKNALRKIHYQLGKLDVDISKVLILGNGEVGSSLYRSLKDIYQVIKYDKTKAKSDIDKSELISVLSEADLIIGCSGNTSLPKELHQHLKQKAVLVSLSSSDREFDAIHLRKHHPKVSNPWQTLNCKGIYLLNSGFPISFDNNNMDDSYFFQFIRSLIMSSIYQATKIKSSKNGFIDLDEGLQRIMIDNFKEYRKLVNL
ncbi:MAG: hypothetical protein K1000chlam1_01135 [Candidatus Anoxychlamydiales bacterium]|nr:hypothetical protein [Candidatus Anoxychlamydiales bacterium]